MRTKGQKKSERKRERRGKRRMADIGLLSLPSCPSFLFSSTHCTVLQCMHYRRLTGGFGRSGKKRGARGRQGGGEDEQGLKAARGDTRRMRSAKCTAMREKLQIPVKIQSNFLHNDLVSGFWLFSAAPLDSTMSDCFCTCEQRLRELIVMRA